MDRNQQWFSRICNLGALAFFVVFLVSIYTSYQVSKFGALDKWQIFAVMVSGFGLWTFIALKQQQFWALNASCVLTALLLAVQTFQSYRLLKIFLPRYFNGDFSFLATTQMANVVTTNILILACIVIVLRFFHRFSKTTRILHRSFRELYRFFYRYLFR